MEDTCTAILHGAYNLRLKNSIPVLSLHTTIRRGNRKFCQVFKLEKDCTFYDLQGYNNISLS